MLTDSSGMFSVVAMSSLLRFCLFSRINCLSVIPYLPYFALFTVMLIESITVQICQNEYIWGGTVAQAVALTIYELKRLRGQGFDSDPLSFPDPTPHLFSFPVQKHSLSYRLKAKSPPNFL